MKRAIRSGAELRRRLQLPSDASAEAAESFATFVPEEFLRRIEPGNPQDPLLRQVLPQFNELAEQRGFHADPVGDLDSIAAGGLLHKYDSRALVITTGACGVHCRYCFRREFPYQAASPAARDFQPPLDYLREHPEIDEVLLSGGDPLTLVDDSLFRLISQIESLSHVRRLRIHTRMPVVIPSRVTRSLVDRLASSPLAVWLVIHANHPQEIDGEVLAATDRIIDAGIPVLNQAVLLRGVNDDAQTLINLCRLLVNHRITPYYLHQLDRVRGAAHFDVPVEKGLELIQEIRTALPGYAVPTYVTEQPGEQSKTVL
jgi:EF-P beta-lysylation protein EpmB